MLTIKNVSRRIQVFNIDAPSFQEMSGPHGYKLHHAVVVDHAQDGQLSHRRLPRMLPSSITFLADEVQSGLPNELLDVVSIKRALEAGGLRLVSQTHDEQSEPEAPPAKAEAKPDKKSAEPKKSPPDGDA